ncbi:MAG: ABC transporter ATP-binding protein [Candidatus Thorarchaeota archaeon]|nr:MAG: ABC transporter ATP-binding protein [Candidatus Thorarchaeota archaeon]
MPPPLLEIKNLSAHIPSSKGKIVTVDDVSLTIDEKECFGLLGESGCGKTSLILAALGFFQIAHKYKDAKVEQGALSPFQLDSFSQEVWNKTVTGSVFYRGTDLLALSARERAVFLGSHISFVPQGLHGALTPIFSIGDQTAEPLEIHESDIRRAAMRERVLDCLDLVNLAAARERYFQDPSLFSGGEAQRILIAISLVSGPYLVIADEPTSALDVTVQAQIMNVLKMVKEDFAVALMIVSHDAGVIAEMSDRVGVMYAGRLVEVGESVQMFHEPSHPYTKGLMDSFPTIAMIRKSAGSKRRRLRGIPGAPPDLRKVPMGCAFHPRCPHTESVCLTERPYLREVERGHLVACHRHDEVD